MSGLTHLLTVTLTERMHDGVTALASQRRIPRTEIVREALERYLKPAASTPLPPAPPRGVAGPSSPWRRNHAVPKRPR